MVKFTVFLLHLGIRPRRSVRRAVARQAGIQEMVTRVKSSAETERCVLLFVCLRGCSGVLHRNSVTASIPNVHQSHKIEKLILFFCLKLNNKQQPKTKQKPKQKNNKKQKEKRSCLRTVFLLVCIDSRNV